jgi:hypothetical protein
MPPILTICNTDSLGEQIQRAFPETRVVKALNTMRHEIMTNPALVPGRILKEWFGWKEVVDVGDITGSRGLEMILPLWLRLFRIYNRAPFNFKIARMVLDA